jgi:hypothetical protein
MRVIGVSPSRMISDLRAPFAHGHKTGMWRPPKPLYLVWYVLVFSLAFTDLVFLPNIFRDSLQLSTVVLIVLVIGLVVSAWQSGVRVPRTDWTSALLYAFLAFATVSVLQSVWSPVQEFRGERLWDKGIRQILALSLCVATYAVTITMVRSRDQVIKSLAVYVGTLGAALIAGLIDLLNFYTRSPTVDFFAHLIHRNVLIAPGQIHDAVVPRLQLLAFEPSMAANYLLSIVPIAFALIATQRQSLRVLGVAAGLLGCLMFVGTFSLGGTLAAWAALTAFVLFGHFVMPWKRVLQVAVVGGVWLAVLSLVPIQTSPPSPTAVQKPPPAPGLPTEAPSTESRLVTVLSEPGATEADVSTSWRLVTLETAWNTFLDHPVAGVGWGNSGFYVLQHLPPAALRHPNAVEWTRPDGSPASTASANNMIARVLAETGMIGGLLFIGWHMGVAWRAVAAIRGRDALALGLLVASAGLVAHYAALSGLSLRYWFFLPAMIVAISQLDAGREKIANPHGRRVARSSGRTEPVTSR